VLGLLADHPLSNYAWLLLSSYNYVRRWTLEGARANFFLCEEELRELQQTAGVESCEPALEMAGAGPGAQQLVARRYVDESINPSLHRSISTEHPSIPI